MLSAEISVANIFFQAEQPRLYEDYIEDLPGEKRKMQFLPCLANYVQFRSRPPKTLQKQEFWFVTLVVITVAVFQIFTREYVNLTSIAFNFWATSGSLHEILFNQILFHLGSCLGCVVPIVASITMETTDQCWILMVLSVVLMVVDQLAGIPQLLIACLFGLLQAALGLLQAQLICEYLPTDQCEWLFQMALVGRSVAGLIYNNEFSQSGLLNFANARAKLPFSAASFYSGFIDVIFTTLALGMFLLARQQIIELKNSRLKFLRTQRAMRPNLSFIQRAKLGTKRTHPHAILLGSCFVGMRALTGAIWPCFIVFLEERYAIQHFATLTHLHWLAQVVTGLTLPSLLTRFGGRPVYIVVFGLLLVLVYGSYLFGVDVSRLVNLHAILLGIVNTGASTCTCAVVPVYLKKTADLNRFFNTLHIWLSIFSVGLHFATSFIIRYESIAYETFPAICVALAAAIVLAGLWYTWWDLSKQHGIVSLS